jgi:FAD/FMN-containing dehydrogenase
MDGTLSRREFDKKLATLVSGTTILAQLGGTHLTTSAIPLSQGDWIQQFGPAWKAFSAAKRRFDPNNVLTPGPGIFPSY